MPFFAIPAVFLLGFFGASLDWNYAFNPSEPTVGAFGDPFISIQLAASPSNGNCLTTDGTNNAWGSCATGGSGLSSYDAWTHPQTGTSATTSGMIFTAASSTFTGGLSIFNATATNATTSRMHISGILNFGGDLLDELVGTGLQVSSGDLQTTLGTAITSSEITDNEIIEPDLSADNSPSDRDILTYDSTGTNFNWESGSSLCTAITGSADLCDGSDGGATFGQAWELFGSGAWLAPTTTKGIIVAASSTIGSGTQGGGLTIHGGATTTGNLLVESSATIGSTLNVQGGTTDLGSDGVQLDHNSGVLSITGKAGAGEDIIFDFANTAGSIEMNSSGAETMDWTNITLSKFTNASSTLFSTNYASSSAWYGGGLLSDCDTAATSKLLWDTTTGRFSCGTDTDTGITAYDAWTHPQAGTSATTSGMIFSAASSTFVGGFSALNSTSTNATSTSLAITTALRLFGTTYTTLAALGNALVNAVTAVTPTGAWDFGGASSLEIPNGTAPTIDAVGEIALDTTSMQLKIATTTTSVFPAVFAANRYPTFSYSTSTAWVGTTTIDLGTSFTAQTWLGFQCYTDTGTLNVRFGDGTNFMRLFNASTTVGTVTPGSNNTFTAAEKRQVQIGTPASSPTKVSCTASYAITAD